MKLCAFGMYLVKHDQQRQVLFFCIVLHLFLQCMLIYCLFCLSGICVSFKPVYQNTIIWLLKKGCISMSSISHTVDSISLNYLLISCTQNMRHLSFHFKFRRYVYFYVYSSVHYFMCWLFLVTKKCLL